MLNMNEHIPACDVIFITLDSLRFDVAQEAFNKGALPNFAKWLPSEGWEERYTPASFTYPAHQAFFSGFLPTKIQERITKRLFVPSFLGSESLDDNTFAFEEASIPAALSNRGYDTVCIGGVGFFNKQTALSNVLPNLFSRSEWSVEMGVSEKESSRYQFEKAITYLKDSPVFLFINVSATHQPTNIYIEGAKDDSVATQKAALTYVDSQLPILQKALVKLLKTFLKIHWLSLNRLFRREPVKR